MSGRLIDADAFKKHLASFVVGGEEAILKNGGGNYWIDGVHTAYREIDNMPTVEQPHGTWIESKQKKGRWYCSECIHTDPTAGTWRELFDFRYPFCPNCGLPMKRTEE